MAKKTYEINLALGLVPFKIYFPEFDDTVEIMFNPSDADLPKRLMEADKLLNKKAEEIGEFKVLENGLPDTEDYVAKTEAMNKAAYDVIDYAFGAPVSEKVFKHCSPFSIVNGEMFILQFLEKMTPVMQDIIEKDREKANKKMESYLAKYRK